MLFSDLARPDRLYPPLVVALVIWEALQLLSFALTLSPVFPWAADALVSPASIALQVISAGYYIQAAEVAIGLFITCVVLAWATLLFTVYQVVLRVQQSEEEQEAGLDKASWRTRVLRWLLLLVGQFAWTPVASQLIVVYRCKTMLSVFGWSSCWTGGHVALAITNTTALMGMFLLSCCSILIMADHSPRSVDPLARPHGRTLALICTCKIVCVGLFAMDGTVATWALATCIGLCAAASLYLYGAYLPYYWQLLNQVAAASYAVVLWVVPSLVLGLVRGPATSTGWILWFGAPLAAACGLAFPLLQWQFWISHPAFNINNVYQVELKARRFLHTGDPNTLPSSAALEQVDALFTQAVQFFPSVHILHVFLLQYLHFYRPNNHVERGHMGALLATPDASLDEVFFAHHRRRLHLDEQTQDRVGVIVRIQIEKHRLEARKHAMRARQLQLTFWSELVGKTPSSNALATLADNLWSEMRECEMHYEALLRLSPGSVANLRAYAQFLQEVANHTQRSQALMQEADDIEAAQLRIQREHVDVVFYSTSELLDMSAENVSVVSLSPDRSRLGVITDINSIALQLFGYARRELLGKNISELMPEPLSSMHDTWLIEYLKSGRATMLDSTRTVFALHRNGYIFPVAQTTRDTEEGFTAVQQTIMSFDNFCIVTPQDMKVTGVCERSLAAFQLDAADLTGGKVIVTNLFPTFMDTYATHRADVISYEEAALSMYEGGAAKGSYLTLPRDIRYTVPVNIAGASKVASLRLQTVVLPYSKFLVVKWRLEASEDTQWRSQPTTPSTGNGASSFTDAPRPRFASDGPEFGSEDMVGMNAPNYSFPGLLADGSGHGSGREENKHDDGNDSEDSAGAVNHRSFADMDTESVRQPEATQGPISAMASGERRRSRASSAAGGGDVPRRVSFASGSEEEDDSLGEFPMSPQPRKSSAIAPKRSFFVSKAAAAAAAARDEGDGNSSQFSGTSTQVAALRRRLEASAESDMTVVRLRRAITVMITCICGVIIANYAAQSVIVPQFIRGFEQVDQSLNRQVSVERIAMLAQDLWLHGTRQAPLVAAILEARKQQMLEQIEIFEDAHKYLHEVVSASQPELWQLYSQNTHPVLALDGKAQPKTVNTNLLAAGLDVVSMGRQAAQLPAASFVMTNPAAFYVLTNVEGAVGSMSNYSTRLLLSQSSGVFDTLLLAQFIAVCSISGLVGLLALCIVLPALLRVENTKRRAFQIFLAVPLPVLRMLRRQSEIWYDTAKRLEDDSDDEYGDPEGRGDSEAPGLEGLNDLLHSPAAKMELSETSQRARAFHLSMNRQLWAVVRVMLPMALFVGGFIGILLWAEQDSYRLRDALTTFTTAHKMQLVPHQIHFQLRKAQATPNTTVAFQALSDATRLMGECTSLEHDLMFGTADGASRPALELPLLAEVILQDACIAAEQRPKECAEFYHGLLKSGSHAALAEFLRLSGDRVLQTRGSLQTHGWNRTASLQFLAAPAAVASDDMIHEYLYRALAALGDMMADVLLSYEADFTTKMLAVSAAFVVLLCTASYVLYRPQLRKLDAELRRARAMVLLFPDQVVVAIPAVNSMVRALTAGT